MMINKPLLFYYTLIIIIHYYCCSTSTSSRPISEMWWRGIGSKFCIHNTFLDSSFIFCTKNNICIGQIGTVHNHWAFVRSHPVIQLILPTDSTPLCSSASSKLFNHWFVQYESPTFRYLRLHPNYSTIVCPIRITNIFVVFGFIQIIQPLICPIRITNFVVFGFIQIIQPLICPIRIKFTAHFYWWKILASIFAWILGLAPT